MIAALGKRCGLQFSHKGREIVAATSAYLPYWMRMAGSYIHRHVDLEDRPAELGDDTVRDLCSEFSKTEGADIAKIALQNLYRVDKPMFDLLINCADSGSIPIRGAGPLLRYGLVRQKGKSVRIESDVVLNALEFIKSEEVESKNINKREFVRNGLDLDESEWAEELAAISRRRNILERKAREFVRVVLRMGLPAGRSWVDAVIASLPSARKEQCNGLSPDALMGKLYWIELSSVIAREWIIFESLFNDKRRLQDAFKLLNERPDAHAKDVDLADVALQRRELTWLEERISQ
jgi:hypothetical protein